MTTVLLQSLNKMHRKYVFHNKFRMIIFHDQKTFSLNFKSSRSQMFFKIDVLRKFRNIHRNTHVLELLFSIVAELEACNCIKKRLQHRCFLVNIAKIFRTPILKNICEQLLCTSNHKVSN